MREILFRAKSAIIDAKPGSEMWVEGDLVQIDGTTYINVDKLLVRVDPDTVGQYTGLTDRNGTRIFEGDILTNYLGNYEVIYDAKDAGFARRNLYPNFFGSGIGLGEVVAQCLTVTGNIHDKPEALKGDEA